jgi:hypothetical protein
MVDAMLDCEVLLDAHSRELLVWLTGEALERPLILNGQTKIVLRCVELVRACDREPGGLSALVEVLRALEPDSRGTRHITELVDERETGPNSTETHDTDAADAVPGAVVALESPPVPPDGEGRKDFFISYTGTDRAGGRCGSPGSWKRRATACWCRSGTSCRAATGRWVWRGASPSTTAR